MNKILQNTHRISNINVLKARDYYFEKARHWHRVRRWLTLIPPILLAISYIPLLPHYDIVAEQRDLFIGIITIIAFIIIHFICEKQITHNLDISNMLREEYDCKVLDIPHNPFTYCTEELQTYLSKASNIPDYYKYEVWYSEIFGDNGPRNALIAQLDNILYTYYAYKEYKRYIIISLSFLLVISLVSLQLGITVFALVVISLFNAIQYYIENLSTTKGLIERNKSLIEVIRSKQEEIKDNLNQNQMDAIRMLQDVVISNRDQSLFIPHYIRNKHLREGSIYYKELNKFKHAYLADTNIQIPSSAAEIDIFSLNESKIYPLSKIQERLLGMLNDVIRVFDKYSIIYTLDGGTLIGAMRSHSFVFWDDDIDLAIPIDMLEKAKEAIRKELGSVYDVQDYESDLYYSPRLSNFRIRDKKSCISEKDSQLYPLYNSRGLFIDIYSYTPILVNRHIDACFRRVFIHPLHSLLTRLEASYLTIKKSPLKERQCKRRFRILKHLYMHHVNWYLTHAKNDEYYVYTPNYIENKKKPGPYIPKNDLYGKKRTEFFEGMNLPVPTCPEKVLQAYYSNWSESPFKTIPQLIATHGADKWFSENLFLVSIMKHINHVDLN